MPIKTYLLLVVIAMLAACAEQPTRSEALIPVEERYVPPEERRDEATVNGGVNQRDAPQPTVIASLMKDAEQHAQAGRTDRAIASLERAIRIEPGNALLWHRFAELRLQEQNWQQAIALARRSNALAANDRSLMTKNWEIIALAYEGLGRPEKAREARRQQRLSG